MKQIYNKKQKRVYAEQTARACVCVLLMHVLLMSLFIYSTFVALKNRLTATGFSCIFYGFAIVSLAPVCLMLVFGYQKVQLFISFVRSTSFPSHVWVGEGVSPLMQG